MKAEYFTHGGYDKKDGYRRWWHFGHEVPHIQFLPFTRRLGASIAAEDDPEDTFSFSLCIPFLFSFYFTMDSVWLMKSRLFLWLVGGKRMKRELSFYLYMGAFNFYLPNSHRTWDGDAMTVRVPLWGKGY